MSIYSDILKMKIRGADNIALTCLKHLSKYEDKKCFENECKKLEKLRPTEVVLHNVIKKLNAGCSVQEMTDKIHNNRKLIECHGRKLVKGKNVMTHCHSTETMTVIKHSKSVYATITEPRNQGIITVRYLRNFTKTKLIIDSACGFYMDDVDMIVIGSDSLRKEGIVNKIGSIPLCITAKTFGKEVYIAANTLKFDNREKFSIEFRLPNEIHESIKNVEILNPAFDIIPWKFVNAVITENGIINPKKILQELKR